MNAAALRAALASTLLFAGCKDAARSAAPAESADPLSAAKTKPLVLLFIARQCPISNRYAPEIQRLARRFAPKGVSFYLVYPDREESADMIRAHAKEYGYDLPVLLDPDHALVRRAGVRVTPEAALLAPPGGALAYRGRIDDLYIALGKARTAPTTRDLEQAIEAVLAKNPVRTASTAAIGCSIAGAP